MNHVIDLKQIIEHYREDEEAYLFVVLMVGENAYEREGIIDKLKVVDFGHV